MNPRALKEPETAKAAAKKEGVSTDPLVAPETPPTTAAASSAAALPATEAEMFALIAEQAVIDNEANYMRPDKAGRFDALMDQSKALDRQIMATRAQTPDGIAWKLRQLLGCLELEEHVSDFELSMARSALADAEKLGGVGSRGHAMGTTADDAALLTDCDRWHALGQDINPLSAERNQRRARLPARFRETNIDPRGAADMGPDKRVGWGGFYDHLCDYEKAYNAADLGEIEDRLEPLHDEQCAIETRLMRATAGTPYGAVRLLSVWITSMCDDVRSAGDPDDWDVLIADAASRMYVLVERTLQGDTRRLAGKAPPYLDLTAPAGDDPQREKKSQVDARIANLAPADLWRRWEEIRVEFEQHLPDETDNDLELRQDLLSHEAGGIEEKILRTPARNVTDVLIKMQLAEGLIVMCKGRESVLPEDRLMLAAYADLKRLTEGAAS